MNTEHTYTTGDEAIGEGSPTLIKLLLRLPLAVGAVISTTDVHNES